MKEIYCFRRRTNDTQKIFFTENQQVTIPVPVTMPCAAEGGAKALSKPLAEVSGTAQREAH
jgi:hypothetical protein